MGGLLTSLIPEAEKVNWIKPHELIYNNDLRNDQLALLPNFGQQLRLCYKKNTLYGIRYQHWYVTDNKYVIEFGGGEIDDNNILVHCNPKTKGIVDSRFKMTDEIMERMKKLCGATNYSLALRNCEHAAR